MTEDELSAIEARAQAATEGPWEAGPNGMARPWEANGIVVRPAGEFPYGEWIGDFGRRGDMDRIANAKFIAHARADVPALVAEVRRLTDEFATSRAATAALLEKIRDRDLRDERGFD